MASNEERLINWGFLIKHPRLCLGTAASVFFVVGAVYSYGTGRGCPALSGIDFVNPWFWGCNIGAGVSGGVKGFDSATVQPWQDDIFERGAIERRRARVTSAPPGAEPPPAIRGGR